MNNSSRSNLHSNNSPFDDDLEAIPAWVYALAIVVITLVVILR